MDREAILKKMNEVFCDVFDDDNLVINFDTVADDIEDWDSLTHITLVMALEREFNIEFNLKKIAGLSNVGEMVELVKDMVR